jgi:hypothetical protein
LAVAEAPGEAREVETRRNNLGMARWLTAGYRASRIAHPFRWLIFDIAEGSVATAALWLVIRPAAGLAFACFWVLLTALMLAGRVIQHRKTVRSG